MNISYLNVKNYRIMKKKYIIPTLQLSHISVQNLVAESMHVNSATTVDQQYVKGESSSSSRYNVWDDNWSAE